MGAALEAAAGRHARGGRSAAYSYSSGVFMVAMTAEFGWSRAQFSSALTVQMLAGLLIVPFAGRVLDRLGPAQHGASGHRPVRP